MRRTLFRFHPLAAVAAAAALLIAVPLALGQDNGQAKSTLAKTAGPTVGNTKSAEAAQTPYLGVGVETLHPALAAQFRDLLKHNEGVLVAEVVPDSPAAKAGVQPHDILTTYGDQRLYSAEQLSRLVRSDKAGNQVSLGVLRGGKQQEINVTLGEHAAPMAQHIAPRSMWRMPQQRAYRPETTADNDAVWRSFDSMTLKNLGDNRFRVEIGYLDKSAKLEHRMFEGTREEIHRDIQAQKDLPDYERDQLLRSLDLPGRENPAAFPGVYYTPDGRMIWEFPSLEGAFPFNEGGNF